MSKRKAEKTKERILSHSLELFQEKGFENTSMRDIASAAGLATGAAYYHFKSKEELVVAFYNQTSEESVRHLQNELLSEKSFSTRFENFMEHKFDQLAPYRSFLNVLARASIDPENPLSPFGVTSSSTRKEAIQLMSELIGGSDLKCASKLKPYLGFFFWLYQMGLLMFWIQDKSEKQERTALLFSRSLPIIVRLLSLSKFPLLRPLNTNVINLLNSLWSKDELLP